MVAQAVRPTTLVQIDRDLLVGIRAALAERFSKAGHVMQLVTQEHRGHCTVRGCAPICLGYRDLFLALDAAIEGQGGLFDEAAG